MGVDVDTVDKLCDLNNKKANEWRSIRLGRSATHLVPNEWKRFHFMGYIFETEINVLRFSNLGLFVVVYFRHIHSDFLTIFKWIFRRLNDVDLHVLYYSPVHIILTSLSSVSHIHIRILIISLEIWFPSRDDEANEHSAIYSYLSSKLFAKYMYIITEHMLTILAPTTITSVTRQSLLVSPCYYIITDTIQMNESLDTRVANFTTMALSQSHFDAWTFPEYQLTLPSFSNDKIKMFTNHEKVQAENEKIFVITIAEWYINGRLWKLLNWDSKKIYGLRTATSKWEWRHGRWTCHMIVPFAMLLFWKSFQPVRFGLTNKLSNSKACFIYLWYKRE